MNADILTSSAGGWMCDRNFNDIERIAVKEILDNGTVIVMPAGNGNQGAHCYSDDLGSDQPWRPLHPYYDDRIIIVSSTDIQDNHHNGADSSHSHYAEVDICAPGYNIMGAKNTVDQSGYPQWPYFGSYAGTSFSTPIVAGTCALIKSVNKCLTPYDIQKIVKQTADPIADANLYPGLVGAGRINAYSAVSLAQTYHTANDTITSNTFWSANSYQGGNIIVDSNATLTVTGVVHFATSARLIVRPGGKLIVDGGTLTSACDGVMWQGIEVVGDRTKQQLAQYQGKVELRNGATIENAWCGIRTGLREDTVTFATTGGIIIATDATFKNNRQSVVINSYAYTAASGNIANYNATFSRCTLVVDNSNLFAANNTAFAEHVRLWDVKGVAFDGCSFSNTTNSSISNGRGIYAEDAGLMVNTFCPPQISYDCECPEAAATHSLFSGFSTAVEILTTGSQYAVSLDGAHFSNNSTGIKVNGNNFATVTRCQFDLDQWPDGHSAGNVGLRLEGCSGYKVEENTFERTAYPTGQLPIDFSTGILVSGTGTANNSLYRNNFTKLTRGISVFGNNGQIKRGGLQVSCNVFNSGKYDIFLNSGATISYTQGSFTKGADNVFNNDNHIVSNLYNPSTIPITYHYYGSGSNLAPVHYSNVTLTTTTVENLCTPTLCNNNGGPNSKSPSGLMSDMDADTYYGAVRAIMSDSLLDLSVLEQWHAAAQPIADPYSLTETRFMEGYAETFAGNTDSAELANYAEFHAMKVALRAQNDNADNQNNINLPNPPNSPTVISNSPTINWYSLTPAQIAQLQTIAERNTGRASVMAKGVLCFFFGICYGDEDYTSETDPSAETRAKRTATGDEVVFDTPLRVWPNPTDDLLFVELRGAEIASVALYDLQGRVVETRHDTSLQGGTATVNVRNVPAGVYVLRVTDAEGKEHQGKVVRR